MLSLEIHYTFSDVVIHPNLINYQEAHLSVNDLFEYVVRLFSVRITTIWQL